MMPRLSYDSVKTTSLLYSRYRYIKNDVSVNLLTPVELKDVKD